MQNALILHLTGLLDFPFIILKTGISGIFLNISLYIYTMQDAFSFIFHKVTALFIQITEMLHVLYMQITVRRSSDIGSRPRPLSYMLHDRGTFLQ